MAPGRPDNSPDRPEGTPRRRRMRYPGRYPRQFDQKYKELDPEAHPEIQDHVRAQGRTPAGTHVPALVAEVMGALRPAPGETVVDCTVGYGGHALEFLRRIGPAGCLLGLDVDGAHLARARERLVSAADELARMPSALRLSVVLRHGNYAGIDRALAAAGLDGCDVIFADLGVASMQIDDPSRGFSYKFDGPLDMRMDSRLKRTAADLLGALSEEELAAALAELGDEPDAAAIAARVIGKRQAQPVARTLELVRLICDAKGIAPRRPRGRRGHGSTSGCGTAGLSGRGEQAGGQDAGADLHPAARTFQALRIMVNDELSALRQLLRVAPACLRPGGRIGVISFHSGEDRLVKLAFRDGLHAGKYSEVSYEPIMPGGEERCSNPRSASAKFRWAVKAPPTPLPAPP